MKSIYISFILLLAIYTFPVETIAQVTYNREETDKNGSLLLLGKSTRSRLQQAPFDNWFNSNYNDYRIDTATAKQLATLLKGKRLVIFMGTWCGDSRREVPRMYKLLDFCGVRDAQIELVNVDYRDTMYKRSPGHEERGLQIHRVPDLLVYDKDKEIGRIVETPVESWEKDLFAILQGQAYSPNYKGVPLLAKLFLNSTPRDMEASLQQIAEQLRPLVTNRFELQSYATIHMGLKDMEKAVLVLRLNTLLFPNDTAVWNSLAEANVRQRN